MISRFSGVSVLSALLAIGLRTLAASAPDTVYVDCNFKDYTGHTGESWELAYKTIQEGVDAVAPGGTVLVAPGWYDEGGTSLGSTDAFLTNRVTLTKKVTVRSKGGRATRDSTFIVGRHATVCDDPNGYGMGLDAVRCVRFDDAGSVSSGRGSVVEGFTLLNGGTHYNGGSYAMCSIGGGANFGVLSSGGKSDSFLVDCVVSNCVATRGGGIYFGNAVRTRFTGNKATSNAPAVRDGNLYYCVIDGANIGSGVAYLGGGKIVNSTIANCVETVPLRGNSVAAASYTPCLAYNTVVLQHLTSATGGKCICLALTNCVTATGVSYYWSDPTDVINGRCRTVDMNSFQFVSTATGDFRPLATGDLATAGDAEHLGFIPETYRYTDYNGNPVPRTGAIAAGAITKTETPVGGAIYFASVGYHGASQCSVFVEGYEHCIDKLYSFGMASPAVLRYDIVPPTKPGMNTYFGSALTRYTNGTKGTTVYDFPLRDTLTHIIMGPPAGDSLCVTPYAANQVFWTDPSVPDGAAMDGSEARPFNTLQAAMDAAEEKKNYNVIFAKKGRYDKGGKFYGGLTNRVALTTAGTYVRLYAVDGPAETFIVGHGDEASAHAYKYGDAAVRCFATCTSCANVSGFTLADGRVTLNNGSETTGADGLYGGAVWGASNIADFQITDCVITNCAASRGAVAWRGVLKRCHVIDCTTTWLGALRGGVHASACVFRNITTPRSGDLVVGQDAVVYNCDFLDSPGIAIFGDNTTTELRNSLVYGFDEIKDRSSTTLEGLFYDACAAVADSALKREGLTYAKMAFADKEAGDYALYSSTRPVTGGSVRAAGADFWRYGSAIDFEGRPFAFNADGSMTAGAVQRTTPSVSVVVSVPADVSLATVSPEGEIFLTPGDPTRTVTATAAATRNFQGFYADGEQVTSEAAYTLTYADAEAGRRVALEARYVPYWYVDPTASDSNGGRSWTDAKRTLAEVMKLAIPGDTVYAAPGTYDEGDMINPANYLSRSTPKLRARVYVTNGVSLVSRDGAATTFIKGKSATASTDGYGGGTDALRCVSAGSNARIVGFTLTGGRSYGENLDSPDDNNRGAGVHGWAEDPPEVRDCVITDCVAARGAGSTYVIAVNCRYIANRAYNQCAAAQHSAHHNCYFDYNIGKPTVGYWRTMRNSTIGAHNDTDSPLGTSPQSGGVQAPAVYNTLILSGRMVGGATVAFTNCAFSTDMLTGWSSNATTNETCLCLDKSLLQADENGVPLVGRNLAIDAGDTNYVDLALIGDRDLLGNPRRVNGLRMDIGCYEADWRARYSADLGARRAEVTSASPAACETEARTVELTDGTSLALDFLNRNGSENPQRVVFRVTGGGTLSLTTGGETFTYTAGAGDQQYVFESTAARTPMDFSFAGEGSAEIVACRRDEGAILIVR